MLSVATLSLIAASACSPELHADNAHRVGRVGKVQLAVSGSDVVNDPLDVSLHQDALTLAADAVGVDEQRLHRRRNDDESVGIGVIMKGKSQSNVERLLVPAPRVNNVDVGWDDDCAPRPKAGDVIIHRVPNGRAVDFSASSRPPGAPSGAGAAALRCSS
jgi:hypothetical protein